ncbi:GTPase-activating protein gyp8 [Xanthoria calcicola]
MPYEKTESTKSATWHALPRHKDEDQVRLDVDRSFIYYPKNQSEPQLDRRKKELSAVITQVLREQPILSYFQGFHDIAQVFLLVLGVDDAAAAVSQLSLLRIRDFMLPSLEPSIAHLHLLPSILEAECPKLRLHLSQTQPFFALAATLTLYAHDIQEYSDIARLFDFFLAHGAVVSVYFFAIIILSRRQELFEIPADEPEMLHSVLSKLPKPLDLEALIAHTVSLYQKFPPEQLPFRAWAMISQYSVLKTTTGDFRQQTLIDGAAYFDLQVAQLRRQEMRRKAKATLWKHRRSAGRVGLAVLVGAVAIWLGKGGVESYAAMVFRRLWEKSCVY